MVTWTCQRALLVGIGHPLLVRVSQADDALCLLAWLVLRLRVAEAWRVSKAEMKWGSYSFSLRKRGPSGSRFFLPE
jgi:hypothetical protein